MPQWLIILQFALTALSELAPVVAKIVTDLEQTNDPGVKAVLQSTLDAHKQAVSNIVEQTAAAVKPS